MLKTANSILGPDLVGLTVAVLDQEMAPGVDPFWLHFFFIVQKAWKILLFGFSMIRFIIDCIAGRK